MKNIYIASCTQDGGIYHIGLSDDGEAKILHFTPLNMPMYMAVENDTMYILLKKPYTENDDSALVSCKINDDGSLGKPSEMVSTKGKVACHLCVFENEVYCTNYSSGSVSIIGKQTVTHSGHGINPQRQEMPHTHCVLPTPDKKYLCVTDLGLDSIVVYDKELCEMSRTKVQSGHGVRHIVFSDDGKNCFAVNELQPTVCAFSYDDGTLTLTDTVKSLPYGFTDESFGAAIRYKNGRIYISNRGHDSISVLQYQNEKLVLCQVFDCGGHWPRDFDIFGDILVCTNEYSHNVTFFKMEQGILKKLDIELEIKAPICVVSR